jgi:hypothetical protein
MTCSCFSLYVNHDVFEKQCVISIVSIPYYTVKVKIPYALVEARRENVLAHAARFCRAGARIVYASSFLRFRISLGLNSEPSKPHMHTRNDAKRMHGI